VEGIGEDMLCKAMDFTVLDDVRQVDDKQCFTVARRLAREEGLFAGGSSGGAVHVAAELARELGKGKVVVAVLPDSGNRYITKFYSDEWMKDNGFLDLEQRAGLVRDLMVGKRKVIAAHKGEKVLEVVARMRKEGVSQVPVTDASGAAVGMIHEVDLLHGLLEGRVKSSDALDACVTPLQGLVTPETPLTRLQDIFADDNVAVVRDGVRVVAIITKIDYIDYLGQRLR
jgi:cystathionine beta-synthase